jgi:intracellular septation protein A
MGRKPLTASAQSPTRLRALLPMLIDVGAPIIVYFILHYLGVGDVLALTIGGMVTAINAVVGTVRRRRLDSIGLLVVAEIALSIALLLITEDPRILLIKPSFYVGFAAIYAFATCFVGQPIGYESAKPFATKGDPERLAAYERAWEFSPVFRRTERIITAGWGVAFLADAILRVVVVFSFSADQVSESLLLSQVPGIVLISAALVFTRLQVPTIRTIVDAQQEELAKERAAGISGSPA